MEDKSCAAEALGYILKNYSREDVFSMTYDKEKDSVIVTYESGYQKIINVACDSVTAMIRDVMRHIGV